MSSLFNPFRPIPAVNIRTFLVSTDPSDWREGEQFSSLDDAIKARKAKVLPTWVFEVVFVPTDPKKPVAIFVYDGSEEKLRCNRII